MTPEERIIVMLDIQDRANMVAINFAGKTISSGDGTYDCLRYDVGNAIRETVAVAIEEDRKSRPHQFIGRNDRDCELCGNPDRDPIHYVPHEWTINAAKQEREACLTIARNTKAQFKSLKREHGEHAAFLIENLIRSRSESEKTEPKQLLTFSSLCACGHVMSDHGYGEIFGYGGCLKARCFCRKFCARSEGEEKP